MKGIFDIVVTISADAEWMVVKRIYSDCVLQVSPMGDWFQTNINVGDRDETIIFFNGGWGKIAAAASTQYIIDCFSPKLLINLGTCGGFQGVVKKEDIILVTNTVVYDIQERAGNNISHIKHYMTDLDYTWLNIPFPLHNHQSIMVSADQDLDENNIEYLIKKYNAIAADWESGSIAYVANRNDVKCLILRGVSDLVDELGGEAYEDEDIYIEGTEKVMEKLIRDLPAWIEMCAL